MPIMANFRSTPAPGFAWRKPRNSTTDYEKAVSYIWILAFPLSTAVLFNYLIPGTIQVSKYDINCTYHT